tara:strand:- start:22918 stop:23781 length:864 start_codon:yes stop_codon:yes gene_type:complete
LRLRGATLSDNSEGGQALSLKVSEFREGVGAGPQLHAKELDSEGAVPLYRQIYTLLKTRIEEGTFAFNSKLPAEETLAVELGVSRITVKRAMNELAAAGFVTRFRGRGTIVSYSSRTPPVLGNYTTPMEHLRRLGFETQIELLHLEVVPATEEIATELFIQPGTDILMTERLRHLEDAPFSHILNYTPLDVAERINEADISWRPFTELLAEAGHAVVCAEQTIQARAVRGEAARALMLADGAPVLTIRRILRDASAKAVQFTMTNYRADRYQYHMVIEDLGRKTPSE